VPERRLIIFDCDGVLVDSEPIATRVAVAWFGEHGIPLDPEPFERRFSGMTGDAVTEIVFAEAGRAPPEGATERRRLRIMAALEAEVAAVEGVAGLLAGLDGPRCVASSSHPDRIRLSLTKTGLLKHFGTGIFSATEVARGKPHPDLFLHAAARMGFAPGDCVVIEDSSAGIRAAKAAGMLAIGYAPTADRARLLGEAGADHVVGAMADVSPLLRALAGAPARSA
jgi:HAD superfamily hydrolase (TIGR01509 family)